MSELKSFIVLYDGKFIRAYEESEADKVIAELEEKHKTEVKELLCLIRDKENNFNRAFDSEEKEIRHHKYKQCLAMAHICYKNSIACANYTMPHEKYKHWRRWQTIWSELAKKFKPNSTAQ